MPRPRLDIGTYGKIRTYRTSTGYRATTLYRDFDGHTRPVERSGKSEAASVRRLKRALSEWLGSSGGDVKPDTPLRELAELWFETVTLDVEQGRKSPTTADAYRSVLDRHVLAGVGELRVREATVARLDRFLIALSRNIGVPSAKTARTVLSGMLAYAARNGAVATNPTRDTRRLSAMTGKVPRALAKQERTQWLEQLEADEKAVRWDLPDLSRFMMATGVRIGEALAVYWEDVHLDQGYVEINYTVVRVKGVGLVRKPTKSATGERTLPLPSWAAGMLKRRWHDAEADDRSASSPVFATIDGGLRDPSNTMKVLRQTRGSAGFGWVTSHVFRKTAATVLDDAGLSARVIADQLGHSKPSMTQDVYLARKVVDPATAAALEGLLDNRSNGV